MLNIFKPKYWVICLNIYFSFIYLFTSSSPWLKDQFAVSYFATSLIVLIQVYNWEIRQHSLVCCCGLADIVYILKQSYPGKESPTSSFQRARESSTAGKPETETEAKGVEQGQQAYSEIRNLRELWRMLINQLREWSFIPP